MGTSSTTTRVGHYLMSHTLGQGTFGKVKLATHDETNVQYAIKILDKCDIKNNDLTANVRREIAIMKALNHRNIVNLREVLSSKHKLYIVMDYVNGGELFDMIEKHRDMSAALARKYFQQLVDGVEYCHERGIVHRDLKPENLLVDEDGTLKITDFGVSSMKGLAPELLFTQCGTPFYAAPEILQAGNDGYNGQKVDSWSCGVILFLLLSGQLPFMEEDINRLYDDIQNVRIEWPPEIQGEAKKLIQMLLTKDPKLRYDLTDVKSHPWFLIDYDENKREFEALGRRAVSGSLPPSMPGPASQIPSGAQRRQNPSYNSPQPSPATASRNEAVLIGRNSSGEIRSIPSGDEGSGTLANGHAPPRTASLESDRSHESRGSFERRPSGNGQGAANGGYQHAPHPSLGQDRSRGEYNSANGNGFGQPVASRTPSINRYEHSKATPKDTKNILNYYHNKSIHDFITDALPGKAPNRIDEVVQKLDAVDIDCVQDIHVVVETMGTKGEFIRWLEEKSSIPTVTAMRLAKLFYM